MSVSDIQGFEGQSWSAFVKYTDKESGSQKKVLLASDHQQSMTICLNNEDISLYGKFPGSEPFILAMCCYCGDRFKVPALAKHLALRHPDGKIIENNEKNNQKIDAKSPASIMKKNKVKSKKELPDSVIHNIPLKPPNKQPSKVLIQVDRRRVNCSTGRDTLYISRNPDVQDIKSTIENCKNEKEIIQKVDAARVKKTKDDRNFPTFKQNSSKLLINGSIDHNESNLFSKTRDKIESKKLKNISHENPEKFENEKFKIHDKNSSKDVCIIENGVPNEIDENALEIKKRKMMPKTKTYNPDRHCGVIGKENSKPCTRPLDCKSHTMSLRRAVRGRSKTFDQLLADHRAEKVSTKHNLNDVKMDINMSPEIITKIQLTPMKIPLVLNPHLTTKVDPVNDILNCNLLSNKSMNGVKLKCDRPEIIHTNTIHSVNQRSHFQSSKISRKKMKKKKKKKKTITIKKSQVKCFSQWHPWYRRIGGLLYTQNNLPSFANLNKIKNKVKPPLTDKKEAARLNLKTIRTLNNANRIRTRSAAKTFEMDNRDWTVDFRLQFISLKNAISTQVYSLEDIKEIYFKLIPENKSASILRIRNESLAISIPRVNPENQFVLQKKRDFTYLHKHIYNYTNSEESSSESDADEIVIVENITDIRYSMMEPVRTFKDTTNTNRITLTPLSGLRNHRFPIGTDERNFNLGVGTLNDGRVCLETIKRLHFVTPSGPMAAALKQLPALPESSYGLVKSLVEE